jgi:hypothetical protein
MTMHSTTRTNTFGYGGEIETACFRSSRATAYFVSRAISKPCCSAIMTSAPHGDNLQASKSGSILRSTCDL